MYEVVEGSSVEAGMDGECTGHAHAPGTARHFQARCMDCGLRRLCIASSLEPEELP
ncbi:MAG TPA: Crp/Fnr family transcriptional regulator, partial [Cupriavidus sp.]|nr:Crp/Fnr family transcriptional regulator [Cupriavidus sp.]